MEKSRLELRGPPDCVLPEEVLANPVNYPVLPQVLALCREEPGYTPRIVSPGGYSYGTGKTLVLGGGSDERWEPLIDTSGLKDILSNTGFTLRGQETYLYNPLPIPMSRPTGPIVSYKPLSGYRETTVSYSRLSSVKLRISGVKAEFSGEGIFFSNPSARLSLRKPSYMISSDNSHVVAEWSSGKLYLSTTQPLGYLELQEELEVEHSSISYNLVWLGSYWVHRCFLGPGDTVVKYSLWSGLMGEGFIGIVYLGGRPPQYSSSLLRIGPGRYGFILSPHENPWLLHMLSLSLTTAPSRMKEEPVAESLSLLEIEPATVLLMGYRVKGSTVVLELFNPSWLAKRVHIKAAAPIEFLRVCIYPGVCSNTPLEKPNLAVVLLRPYQYMYAEIGLDRVARSVLKLMAGWRMRLGV